VRRQCRFYLDDWSRFEALPTGLALASALRRLISGPVADRRYGRLLAHPPTLEALRRGDDVAVIRDLWRKDLEAFQTVRGRYLLYP